MENKNEIENVIPKSSVEGIKIVERLLKQMHKDIKDLMGYENLEEKHKNIIKSVARVNKIALTLQKTLDLEKGGEIAKNLDHLYQHIRYAVIRVHDDHDFTFLQSAEKVTASINEGWSKMSLAAA